MEIVCRDLGNRILCRTCDYIARILFKCEKGYVELYTEQKTSFYVEQFEKDVKDALSVGYDLFDIADLVTGRLRYYSDEAKSKQKVTWTSEFKSRYVSHAGVAAANGWHVPPVSHYVDDYTEITSRNRFKLYCN